MQMTLLPWLINLIPAELYAGNWPLTGKGVAVTEYTKRKLNELFKLSKEQVQEEADDRVKLYFQMCKILKLTPELRIPWQKESRDNAVSPLAHCQWQIKHLSHLKRDLPAEYVTRVKAAVKQAKATIKADEAWTASLFYIGAENWDKLTGAPQRQLWQAIRDTAERIEWDGTHNRDETQPTLNFSLAEEDIENTNTLFKKLIGKIRNGKLRTLMFTKTPFYLCPVTSKVGHRTLNPPTTVYIYDRLVPNGYFEFNNVVPTEFPSKKWKRLKVDITEKRPPEIAKQCFVDSEGALVQGDELSWSEEDQAYIMAKPTDRWLCSARVPQPGLLNYSHQPNEIRDEIWVDIRDRQHRIGIEVEYQTPYTKGCCIRNKEGRPLTPVKVLDTFGWALCPDRSVDGGELKSTLLTFSTAEEANQILDQVPQEIQKYIDEVNKNDKCGGHLNYSHTSLTPLQCGAIIASWGFVFPILYPKRINKHHCKFQALDTVQRDHDGHGVGLAHKYQWLRQKRNCIEARMFEAHWDMDNIIWRAKLVALMIEDGMKELKETKKKAKEEETPTPVVPANMNALNLAIIHRKAKRNWDRFSQFEKNRIRQHIIGYYGVNHIVAGSSTPVFKEAIKNVLGFEPTEFQPTL